MSRPRTYKPRAIRRGDPLTPRELQILALVAAGETTPAISKQLGIAQNTIKTHLTSIYKKTGSANRVQAVRHYLHNFTTPGPESPPAPPPPSVTAPASETATGSPIAQQINEIQARLDHLAPAATEAERLRHTLKALRTIDPG